MSDQTPLAAPDLEADVVVAIGTFLLSLTRESTGAYGAVRYIPVEQSESDESSR